ncbi:hypothetical protein, partial [Pseudomonas aeruginosa]|uniref:hypothetical protein n=1 Tax=Pseudomonas aeruginosa TaxID=287 RepID=UPI0015C67A0F
MKKHSTARRVLALGLNLTLAGVPALLWADEEPTELPALTVSAGGETPPALDLDDSAGGAEAFTPGRLLAMSWVLRRPRRSKLARLAPLTEPGVSRRLRP